MHNKNNDCILYNLLKQKTLIKPLLSYVEPKTSAVQDDQTFTQDLRGVI